MTYLKYLLKGLDRIRLGHIGGEHGDNAQEMRRGSVSADATRSVLVVALHGPHDRITTRSLLHYQLTLPLDTS